MSAIEIITEADQKALETAIDQFLKKSESRWASLVDKGGNLFAQAGDSAGLDLGILSALGAGSFSATHELARRLGEEDFSSLYHEGKSWSILMTALQFDCLLITVFGQNTNVGLVRHYAQDAVPNLNDQLCAISRKPQTFEPLNADLSGTNVF